MENLQTEVQEMEFLQFSKGLNFMRKEDFAEWLLFFTNTENKDIWLIGSFLFCFSAEFKRAVKVATGQELSNNILDTVFKIFDLDGDECLSHGEFLGVRRNMAPWTLWRCCQRVVGWVPVLFITFVVVWSYYAYVVELCVFTVSGKGENVTVSGKGENGKTVVYLVAFHLFFVMFVWSYWMTIFTSPASPSKEFYLSNLEKERYEKEFSQERQQDILRRAARDLPVYTTSASKAIRYCEKCQLIKPDRAHHCSACDRCVLKMDHHCPWVNNCVGFTNYKFFMLFLLYSLLYCLFVASTVLEYFIKFWTNELKESRAKFHVLFLFFVSAMFFVSVLSLFSYHCWLVGKNRTTIESFRAPMFSYGIDGNGFSLGCSKNWRQVFGDEKKYWLVPVFSSLGDGCSFPTRLVGMDPEQASVANQSEYARRSKLQR